jgi:C-terminal processing protease CtpA/Prc
MNETYLYFDEVTDTDPNGFTDTEVYFDELLTTTVSPAGRPTDRFSFTQSTEDFEATRSGDPVFGYGAEFARIQTNTLPRDWRVSFTQDGSNAETAGFTRGARILEVNGVDFLNGNTNAEVDAIVEGLFPPAIGVDTTFRVRRPDGTEEDVTVTSQSITIEPVNKVEIITENTTKFGYIHYHTFSPFSGEEQLFDAFTQLAAEDVDELILDFRYNGGGLLALAAQIGYMVAGGDSPDRTFYLQEFNGRTPGVNPVTGQTVTPIPFLDEGVGFSVNQGTSLPTLDLDRVFILTTERSCSASEAVMNGLAGIGVEVIQIGTRTCGKSTGQFPLENCGVTYAPLHFRGVNDAGFGDFDDGFAPGEQTGSAGPISVGCEIPDDFGADLGTFDEGMTNAAISYALNDTCPDGSSGTAVSLAKAPDTPLAARSFGPEDALEDDPRVRLMMDADFGALDMTKAGAE